MDVRQLKHFLAVCEEMSFGRAAERANLSQPALSRQIQALEYEIGTTLFDRSAKTIRLTPAGQDYEQSVRVALRALEEAAQAARARAAGHTGELRVGIFGSAILDFIPQVISRFAENNPQVRVKLMAMDKDGQIDALRKRTLDLGFNRLVPDEPDIRVELVRTEPLVLAMRDDHPLAACASVDMGQILDLPLIVYPAGVRNSLVGRIQAMFADYQAAPLIAQEVPDPTTAIALAASGLGVCIVPHTASLIRLRNVCFRPFTARQPATINLACIYRRDDRSPVLAHMLATVRAVSKENPPPASTPGIGDAVGDIGGGIDHQGA